jgi:GNAT superfamily N-acetyltransferase
MSRGRLVFHGVHMTHIATGSQAHVIRVAAGPDIDVVRELDDAAFPPDSPDKQRAAPGELEWGVEAGDIYLLENDRAAVGYVYADRSSPNHIYISGLAIRPEFQGAGLGSVLMDHLLAMVPPDTDIPIVTVTSPRNARMLHTLFRRRFVARWLLRNYFGPGKHRFGCQLLTAKQLPTPPDLRTIAVTELGSLFSVMEAQDLVVRALAQTPRGLSYVLGRARPGELLPTTPP